MNVPGWRFELASGRRRTFVRTILILVIVLLLVSKGYASPLPDWLWPAAAVLVSLVHGPGVATLLAGSLGVVWWYRTPAPLAWQTALGTVVITCLAWFLSTRQQLLVEYRRLNRLDPLTRLLNRTAFYEVLAAEQARTRRFGRPLSVAMIDCDHFKQLNDRSGHLAGDSALMQMSEVLRRETRAYDGLGRLGGDEFALVLPETDQAQAEQMLQRICQATLGLPTPLPLSAGICTDELGTADLTQLIQAADRAMYVAKSQGGNGVVGWNYLTATSGTLFPDTTAPVS